MEGHLFAPVILTYHNVYLVYSAYLFQLITTVFQRWLAGRFFHFTDTLLNEKQNPFDHQSNELTIMQLWFI